MVSPFTTFEFRRWVVAGVLTLFAVSLQVAHAARATDGDAGAAGSAPGAAAAGRSVVPILPVEVDGTVVVSGDGLLGVQEATAPAPVSFTLDDGALLIRDDGAANVGDLRAGDRVRMTVDGGTGRILQMRADPAAAGWGGRLDTLGPLAAMALVIALGLLAGRRWAPRRPVRSSPTTAVPAASPGTALTPFGRGRPVALRHQNRAYGA